MTKEEFLSLQFEECGHFCGRGGRSEIFVNKEYGIHMHRITHVAKKGYVYGKCKVVYEYKDREYGSVDQLMSALKKVEFRKGDV